MPTDFHVLKLCDSNTCTSPIFLFLQGLTLCFGQCFRKRPLKYVYLWVSGKLAGSLIPELWEKRALKYFRDATLGNFLFQNVRCTVERLKTLTIGKEEPVSYSAAQSWLLLGTFFYLHSWGFMISPFSAMFAIDDDLWVSNEKDAHSSASGTSQEYHDSLLLDEHGSCQDFVYN